MSVSRRPLPPIARPGYRLCRPSPPPRRVSQCAFAALWIKQKVNRMEQEGGRRMSKESRRSRRTLAASMVLMCLAMLLAARAEERSSPQTATAHGCCGSASAATPGQKGPEGSKASAATWQEAVGLTADQKERLTRIDAEWRSRWEELNRKVRQRQDTLNPLVAASVLDLPSVKLLIKQIMGYQAELQIGSIEFRTRRQQVLSPQQREALVKWQAASKGATCSCGSQSGGRSGGCGSGGTGCGSAASSPAPVPATEAAH